MCKEDSFRQRLHFQTPYFLARALSARFCSSAQGCGVGVETGVGVGRSRPFWPESELESAKFYRLRLRPGVARYHPSKDNDFGRTVKHRLENIERQKEKESGSVKLKLERHLVVEFGLKKSIGNNFTAIAILL